MVQTMDSPPFDLQGYEPPISLWNLIEQHITEHERAEIKNMLGESLIDQSVELHLEIDTLLDIWRDYRAETTKTPPAPTLAEPPGLRDRLVQEIQFFVENVKEKAKNKGVNPDKILSRHNTEILEYALDTHRCDSARGMPRPMTARSCDGRETPMITSPTLSSERASMASTLSEDIDSMNDKLNILQFDEVVAHLRSTLEEEVETLLKDIGFLQNCLDDEATFRAESVGTLSREPSIAELSRERTTLEKDMFSNITAQTSPPLRTAFTPPSVIKPLVSSAKLPGRLKPSPGAASSHKSGPLKAFTSSDSKPNQSVSTHSVTNTQRLISPGSDHLATGHGRTEHPSSADKEARSASGHVRHRAAADRHTDTLKTGKVSEDDSGSGHRRSHRRGSSPSSKPVIGAIVTLSKESSGDTAERRMIPSPPSGQPTTPRPSSAQRFRRMVLDCRD